MMARRQLSALIAGLGLAVPALAQTRPVVAAGQSAAALRAQALGRRLTIATVVKVGGIAWFDRMHAAIRQFGVDTGHEMIIASPARAEPAAQIAVIEQMIARRVDAICVVPVAVERLEDVLQRARAADIAVIAHEASTLDHADIILEAFDNRAFGALMMQELGLRLNGQGQYISMVGSLQTGTHMEWVNAAVTYQRQRFPSMREAGPKIEIFEDADVAHRRLAEALATNPDIRGVIGAPMSAVVGAAQPDFYSDNRSLRYLFSIIQHSEKIVSMYVGLADGSFRQARQIEPNVEVQGKLPPPEARYAFRWIDAPTPGTAPTDQYLFLDAQQKEIGKSKQVTAYDPRARMWYRMTQQAGGPFITDPDVFAALGLIGFTVGAPIFQEGKLLGIAAADITLDGLSDYLAERKISPGTLSYILDHQGRVIANSERTKTYTNYNGRVELQHITSLGNDVPAIAFSARPRDSEKLFSFSHDGRDYVASLTTLPSDFGKQWQLFVVTPLGDFTSAFDEQNKRLALFGAIAILLQICIIYFLSSVVSAPLERLALKVTKIQNFEGYDLPSLQSPIREVEVLARAIDTLDSAVKSFAAFVPVGLVRQLLDSDQKLVLGGHSRFLTIFFSDLEAFSTMSEEVPSQELLSRVSAYLGVVTHAVNMEHGTIDKFIGDGVMAFWGAPALLEDHAQRSCFAALRIREGMKELNAGWEAAGAKPLNVRIGIHSDAVLVGNIGSKERMSYTVMGDGVNIAARLEGINKEYGTRICISHTVFKEAGERLCVRPVDDVTVKGRRSKVPIYELVGAYGIGREFEPDEVTVRLCDLTRKAYTALVAEDYVLALSRYQEIAAEYPDDPVARTMAKRLAAIDPSRLVSLQMSR